MNEFNNDINQIPKEICEASEKAKDNFSTLDFALSLTSVILGFLFTKFVLFGINGFITTAFYLIMIAVAIVYIKRKGFTITKHKYFEASVLAVFSLVFSITDTPEIKIFVSVFILISGIYWVYSICKSIGSLSELFIVDIFISVFAVPFSKFFACNKALFGRTTKSKNIIYAVVGIICALPVTIAVASLLMSADENMASLLNSVFNDFLGKITSNILYLVVGLPVAFYIFGMLYANTNVSIQSRMTHEQFSSGVISMKALPNVFSYAFVTPVCVLYIIYFFIQLNYFVSAFFDKLPSGFTYAEYARKGFFELFAVCIINALILLGMNILSKNGGRMKNALMKIYNTVICVFTILLVASALSKMFMYISTYGLTKLRIYTSWVMLLIAICFIAVIAAQFVKKSNLIKTFFAIFTIMFTILCFSGVDGIIARYNIHIYKSGSTSSIDGETLVNLSDDAWIVILKNRDSIEKDMFSNSSVDWNYINAHKEKYDQPYSKFNIPSLIVYNQIKD